MAHWSDPISEQASCAKRSLCTKAKVRGLLLDIREPLLNRMRERLLSTEEALKYFKRQYTIEPIFGHLKYNLGYSSFSCSRVFFKSDSQNDLHACLG
ncbi:MAG: hypothetical protein HON76_16675 [Candidatus Scalindua sp.]|nr:hypothetical protein [Candidatus Scalindua sp.]MBT5306181.1 hypothetical protein [Candidatus Scalindua sp.]MBT6230027.1 hypothetical protein [Candidatus Scalindua sp.]MBT6564151.1 hypothetical protein [Candidatus Scalindua sp.]MBT7210049.1 hypothetical protein [Candidatus Scalindua sp.]